MDTNHTTPHPSSPSNTNLKLNGLSSEPLDPALHEVESLLARAAAAERAAAGPTLEDRLMLATAGTLARASRSLEHPAGRVTQPRGRRAAMLALAAALTLLVTVGAVWVSRPAQTLVADNTAKSTAPSDVLPNSPNTPTTPASSKPPVTLAASSDGSEEVFLAMTNAMDALSQLDGELPEVLTLLASETTQLEESLTTGDEWAADSSM